MSYVSDAHRDHVEAMEALDRINEYNKERYAQIDKMGIPAAKAKYWELKTAYQKIYQAHGYCDEYFQAKQEASDWYGAVQMCASRNF